MYKHSIKVTDENKFIWKTYPIPIHYQKQVEVIKPMVGNNIIEWSNSNFLNPIVVVKKNNNDIRISSDMRNLNSIIKKSFNCAANTEMLFYKCQGVWFMSRLDFKSPLI